MQRINQINQRFHAWYNPYAVVGDIISRDYHPIELITDKEQSSSEEVKFRVWQPGTNTVETYIVPFSKEGVSVVTLQNPDSETWDKEDGVPLTITLEIPVVEKEKVRSCISESYRNWVIVDFSAPDPDFEDEF